jgi:predicted SnoaL-like aldol condensation-catalyzing enzyme
MPGVVATVKHVAAEGEFVAVHWQASATPDDEFSGQAVIHLWRVTDAQVVEHWDGFQNVRPSSVSGNSMLSDVYAYPQAAPTISEDQEHANRQMVEAAITDLYNNANVGVLDQVFDPRYYQHNPNGPNGSAGLAALGTRLQSLPPANGPRLTVTHSLADADLVVLIHNGPGGSIDADIFRVVDDKIIEHWDVLPSAQSSS